MFMIQGLGSGPDYYSADQLYNDKNTPYLYAYFTRKLSMETSGSISDNYLKGSKVIYYNFNVRLTGKKNSYEQVKGYANVEDAGACSDGIHGYIKFKAAIPTGGGATLNPVTYTTLNVGRYNLPQIIFPGSDPDESDLVDILSGLKEAFEELVSATKSPIVHLVKMNEAKIVNLNKCYVRLAAVGLFKKGGGQRVKNLLFFDSWLSMAGGNEQTATYGKQFDYTINDPSNGHISSGVASYEPLIGGDENPLRQPIPYIGSSGSNFPPNDPVDLYQETPIGETLYPPASVGYRQVTVRSINANVGNSSQGIDVYQFYTAKDFPVKFNTTGMTSSTTNHFDLFNQDNEVIAKQGYVLTFNDMHGKPKSIDHQVLNRLSNTVSTISYQVYNYKQSGGDLDNSAKCLVNTPGAGMTVVTKQLGIESDITIDSREKKEDTRNHTINGNLNVSAIAFLVIPIPLIFPWGGSYHNKFQSATVTKVIQKYGILDNIQSYNDGAVTTVKNEVFDPLTGQVVVTSVNNEFQDKEYTVDIPAYWCYNGMGPTYANLNYQFSIPSITVDTNYMGTFAFEGNSNINVGDEMEISYTTENGPYDFTVWLMGSDLYIGSVENNVCPGYQICCAAAILPRFPLNTPGWYPGEVITNAKFKVTKPGPRNMFDQNIEKYTMLNDPTSGGILNNSLSNVINLAATTFSDSNTRITLNNVIHPDSINPFAIGERGVYRVLSEYSYVTNRNYAATTTRNAGLFGANSLFSGVPVPNPCTNFPNNYIAFSGTSDPNWHVARTITKWSPNGKEVENCDAIGNYSTSIYGYDESLPIAVAANARQGEILFDGFEGYNYFIPASTWERNNYSPFIPYIGSSLSIVSTAAHTGMGALSVPGASGPYSGAFSVSLPINSNPGYAHNRYNKYYPFSYGFTSPNEYLPFELSQGKKYILSFWISQPGVAPNSTSYSIDSNCGIVIDGTVYSVQKKTNLIDGWQQYEVTFPVSPTAATALLTLPANVYLDDVRLYPDVSNMKAFVYNQYNGKLMAVLDENNFSTFYEYDQEGNLIRTKKETERGVMTISESRIGNVKQ